MGEHNVSSAKSAYYYELWRGSCDYGLHARDYRIMPKQKARVRLEATPKTIGSAGGE